MMTAHRPLSEFGRAALTYARQGWPVFPCCPKTKKPLVPRDKDANGKRIGGTGGHYKATTDGRHIVERWLKNPHAMICVATGGLAGGWALDPDIDDDTVTNGLRDLAELQREHGTLPETVATRAPRRRASVLPLGPHAASYQRPGAHPAQDQRVRVRRLCDPTATPARRWPASRVASLASTVRVRRRPDWLYGLLARDEPKGAARPLCRASKRPRGGSREERYAEAALVEEACKLAATAKGPRNKTLNETAFRLGQIVVRGWLDRTCVEHELLAASRANGLMADGEASVRATIVSGLAARLQNPAAAL
ncbi:bifunctional DNA primase/polymerase [Microvirga massiliensis]|uniref:bifunctional DNA primase/polymerase n=1 Tax=Microvirga massiliensis TaxID=1033741 RepID=UPI00062BC108|nr:bifunctional DNA primase/polymerase [Microvirga massiliensis]